MKPWHHSRWVCAPLAAAVLAACSSTPELDEVDLEPAELVDFDETLELDRCWSRSAGDGPDRLRFPLRPVVGRDVLFVAGRDGQVSALDPVGGAERWEIDIDRDITAGPGLGEAHVAVGADDAHVVLLSAADGTRQWEQQLSAEVVAAPAIGAGTVVVRTADGFLYGLNLADGEQRWAYSQTVPSLTLRGASAPIIEGQTVYAGFDNGKLTAINIADGSVVWELIVARASGRSELERLVDMDGEPLVGDGRVFAGSYQGRLVAVSGTSGREIWDREFSTYVGLAGSRSMIFAVDDQSHIWAIDADSGKSLWQQDELRGRGLTAPRLWRGNLVVGDAEGYVHFLSARDGEQRARRSVSDSVQTAPVSDLDRLYVQDSNAKVTCFREPPSDDS